MMITAAGQRPLRRVVWRHLRSNTRLEFCEATLANARMTLTGSLLADAEAVPAYASYELTCAADLTRCMALRVECISDEQKRTLTLQQESSGRWFRNGTHVPELDGCTVQPVAQRYTRLSATRYRYRNEDSGYEGHIDVDELGLPLSYEGVWTRTADWSAA